jgi:hypothetical protein
MTPTEQQLLSAVVKRLKIDRPILRYEVKGRTVKLWLYGGDGNPVTYTLRAKRTKQQ